MAEKRSVDHPDLVLVAKKEDADGPYEQYACRLCGMHWTRRCDNAPRIKSDRPQQ
jgi:hypothetical protein